MSEWKEYKLEEVGLIVTGSTPSTSIKEYWEGDIPFYSPADFTGNLYCQKTEKSVSEKAYKLSRGISANTIMFACIASIGKMALSLHPGLTNQQINSIMPYSWFDYRYVYYMLLFSKSKFINLAPQTTIPIINKTDFSNFSFLFPPLSHQRKIARILTTVDNIIEKTEAAIAKYKAIKQGMMHDLFTRGIDVKTGKLRPRFEDAPELYKETELGWIPKEWEVKRMDEIGCIISGGTPSSNIPDYWNGSIIWVTPADLSKLKFGYIADSERKITSFGLKNSSALLIPQRSIVLSSRAPIGYCAIVEKDFTTNQGCKSLALFEGNSAEFFYYNIVNHVSRIKLKGEGTTFAEISKKALEKIPFVWCKPKEQTEIAKRLISIDNHTQNEESFLAKYQKLKSGLMQDLLTGKKEGTPDPEDYKEMEN